MEDGGGDGHARLRPGGRVDAFDAPEHALKLIGLARGDREIELAQAGADVREVALDGLGQDAADSGEPGDPLDDGGGRGREMGAVGEEMAVEGAEGGEGALADADGDAGALC